MAKIITASIDLTQLDKKRFKEMTRKNGNKAVFCELVLIETPGGQWGDFMIKQQVTQEERKARLEMPIIGNGKNVGGGSNTNRQEQQESPRQTVIAADDEIPF
jgi:hypothetical protein